MNHEILALITTCADDARGAALTTGRLIIEEDDGDGQKGEAERPLAPFQPVYSPQGPGAVLPLDGLVEQPSLRKLNRFW